MNTFGELSFFSLVQRLIPYALSWDSGVNGRGNEITVHLLQFVKRLDPLHTLILAIVVLFIYFLVEFLKFVLIQTIENQMLVVFVIFLVLIAIGTVTAYAIECLTKKIRSA